MVALPARAAVDWLAKAESFPIAHREQSKRVSSKEIVVWPENWEWRQSVKTWDNGQTFNNGCFETLLRAYFLSVMIDS